MHLDKKKSGIYITCNDILHAVQQMIDALCIIFIGVISILTTSNLKLKENYIGYMSMRQQPNELNDTKQKTKTQQSSAEALQLFVLYKTQNKIVEMDKYKFQ